LSGTPPRWSPEKTTGSVVSRQVYDALGNVTRRIEAEGRPEERITLFEYDTMGRQVKTTLPEVRVYQETEAELRWLAEHGDRPEPWRRLSAFLARTGKGAQAKAAEARAAELEPQQARRSLRPLPPSSR